MEAARVRNLEAACLYSELNEAFTGRVSLVASGLNLLMGPAFNAPVIDRQSSKIKNLITFIA